MAFPNWYFKNQMDAVMEERISVGDGFDEELLEMKRLTF